MINPIPIRRRQRRYKARVAAQTPAPPVPHLILVAAEYDPSGLVITLQFDQSVLDDSVDGSQISVNDPVTNNTLYLATGEVGGDGSSVSIGLVEQGPASGEQVRLSASASTGIVGSDSGETWDGVSDVVLPFP
jgi:hypothetical protein